MVRDNSHALAMKRLILPFVLSLSSVGATFYVDLDAGDNSAAGTSTGAAWRNIPGTRNAADSAFVTASGWVAIAAGDTIRVKSGTTQTSAEGGKVAVSSAHYATGASQASPILIVRDTEWGSGAVLFDGSGVSTAGGGYGGLHVTVVGVGVEGMGWHNWSNSGVSFRPTTYGWLSVSNCAFWTNGTAHAATYTGSDASVKVDRANAGGIFDSTFLGGNQYARGIHIGESSMRVTNFTVANCTLSGFTGDDTYDQGVGVLALNSQVTVSNVTASGCFKGADLGEVVADTSWDLVYKVVNCTFRENLGHGVNVTSSGTARTGAANFYLWNNLVISNALGGTRAYAGAFDLVLAHNVYHGNGYARPTTADGFNIDITPNGSADTNRIRAYLYNNFFYQPGGAANLRILYHYTNLTDQSFTSDHNSWVGRTNAANEDMAFWSYSVNPQKRFEYTDLGGIWQTYYGASATPLDFGTGHFGCDPNSTTNAPYWVAPDSGDYTLASGFTGLNLSGESWFIPEMGVDRLGRSRWRWDLGTTEYGSPGTATATANSATVGTLIAQ